MNCKEIIFKEYFLIFIGFIAMVSILGTYFYKFGSFPISSESIEWANLGTYFSGMLNPLIGIITAFYAFRAFQSTQNALEQSTESLKLTKESLEFAKETACHENLNTMLNIFYKSYDDFINNMNSKYKDKIYIFKEILQAEYIDDTVKYNDNEAINRIYYDFISFIDQVLTTQPKIHPSVIWRLFIFVYDQIWPIFNIIEVLEDQVDDAKKDEFIQNIKIYMNKNLLHLINRLLTIKDIRCSSNQELQRNFEQEINYNQNLDRLKKINDKLKIGERISNQ